MKIENPERIAEMVVCRDCQDVVGPFWRLYGTLEGQGPLPQRGRCELHAPRGDAPTWPRFDFNRGVDLCWCCGVEPLASGSRWSVWFCDACKEQVGLLNARHGRCIIPIGRHSVHWGWLLRAEDAENPLAVQGFIDAAKAATVASTVLADWHHIAVGLNLERICAEDVSAMPLLDYWRAADESVSREDRFRGMCAYMDERGRALLIMDQKPGVRP